MAHPADYFNSGCSTTVVNFGFDGEAICVLLARRKKVPYSGAQTLPGRMLDENEEPEPAARQMIANLLGHEGAYIKPIRAFSDPGRHPNGRVVSLGYYSISNLEEALLEETAHTEQAAWVPLHEIPQMPFDHNQIVNSAYRRLKRRLRHKPVALEFFDEKLTLPQLQRIYEYLLERELDKRNFRRKILKYDLLVPLEEYLETPNQRPARLYRTDPDRYLQLRKSGQNFAP